MEYYFSRNFRGSMAEARSAVELALKNEGFAVKTEMDVAGTFKEKLGVDFKGYVILGACNPSLAFRALKAEDKLGIMLPCNVVLIDQGEGNIEIAAVDPRSMMNSIGNPDLSEVAGEVFQRLRAMMDRL